MAFSSSNMATETPIDKIHELRLLVAIALPSALVAGLRMGQMLTDQAIIGHLTYQGHETPIYLDSVVLALLWMRLTISTGVRAIGPSVNLLTAQALGAGNVRLAGTWLYTGALCSVIFAAGISGSWLLTGPVVSLFASNQTLGVPPSPPPGNQTPPTTVGSAGHEEPAPLVGHDYFGGIDGPGDPVVLAALYARLSVGYVLPTLWMEAVCSWLLAHRCVRLQVVVYALAFALNVALNLVLVHGLPPPLFGGFGGFGFSG